MYDQTIDRRKPLSGALVGRGQLVAVVNGAPVLLVPAGSVWVGQDNPQIEVRVQGTGWVMYDGAGRSFVFDVVNGLEGANLVEQTPGNVARFGAEAIHNTGNLVTLPQGAGSIHARISGLYSSIRPAITGSNTLTVRRWLSTQSFEAQAAFGRQAIENVEAGLW